MKKLMSINHKFFEVTENELVELSKNKIDGFEVYIRDKKEYDYLKKLSVLCNKENLYLQLHGNVEKDINDIKSFLDLANEVSKILGYTIDIVFHSKISININKSLENSICIFTQIFDYITNNNLNIRVSIENLNSVMNIIRLDKQKIIPILKEFDDLMFTYDIGHELIEKGNIIDLDQICIDRLINIHIHTFKKGLDHQFIYKDDKNYKKIEKAFNYLKKLNYNEHYVFEYDLYKAKGKNVKDKINYYIKMIGKIQC